MTYYSLLFINTVNVVGGITVLSWLLKINAEYCITPTGTHDAF